MTGRDQRLVRLELVAASVLTGIFGAITIYASEWKIGLADFAPLAQLWTLWALFSASITFGVQRWVIRAVVVGRDRRAMLGWFAPRLVVIAILVTAIAGALSDIWFDGGWSFPVLCGLLALGTAANGWARAIAAATSSTHLLATLVVGENLIRLVLLVPLFLTEAAPVWYGVALLTGFSITGLGFVAPAVLSRYRVAGAEDAVSDESTSTDLALAIAVGLVGYATMFGGPLLLALSGADDSLVSALFLVMTLARIPFVVVLGLMPRFSAQVESAAAARHDALIRQTMVRAASACVLSAAGVFVVAWFSADPTFGRLLGTGGSFGGETYALIGAASVVALGTLIGTIVHLAVARRVILLAAWAVPVAGAIVGVSTGWLDTAARLGVGLLVAELFVLAVLTVGVVDRAHRRVDTISVHGGTR